MKGECVSMEHYIYHCIILIILINKNLRMVEKLLQNHPNKKQYPVSSDDFKDLSDDSQAHKRILVINAILMVVSIILLILWLTIAVWNVPNWDYANFLTIAQYIWIAFGVAFALQVVISSWVANAPIREQKLYYKLTNTGNLNRAKRQGLRLDLYSVYEIHLWPETLEFYPLEWRVELHKYRFKYLPLARQQTYMDSLKKWWGISSKKDAMETLEHLLRGMHAPLFARDAKENYGFIGELVEKLNLPKEYEHQLLNPINGYPPQLIWAFDLWRAVSVARSAFSARYLTEDEAWGYILRASELSFEVFESYDSFLKNMILGRAFWGGDDMIQDDLKGMQDFSNCTWPMKSLPWNKKSDQILPEYIMNGFGVTRY